MINVDLTNGDTTALAGAFTYFASQPVLFSSPSSGELTSDTETAYSVFNGFGGPDYSLTGTDFSYDPSGRLMSGTITGIKIETFGPPDNSGDGYSSETFTGLSLPVSDLLLLAPTLNPAPAVLAAGAAVVGDSPEVHTFGGDDTIVLSGGGTLVPVQFGPYRYPTGTTVDAGGGANTVVFNATFRDQASVAGGGGNETVQIQPGVFEYLTTATLVAADKLQFIDGSIYENNATPDAQAALMFRGVFGRPPDALNAGNLGQLATASGRLAAANAMLASPEGSADIAGLSDAAFVTRLYQNVLGRTPDAPSLAGWTADLDSGTLGRGDLVERFAAAPEAQTANAATFAGGQVFAADPNAVEVLRAYSTLLNRLPETSALSGNVARLAGGLSLQDFYAGIQASGEFASDGAHQGGITATTGFTAVYDVLHSASVTAQVGGLVNATTGVAHQPG